MASSAVNYASLDKKHADKKRMYLSGCSTGQEVIPECEVMLENDTDNLTSRYKRCKKHPFHENFISVSKFSVEDLPPKSQNLKMMDEIFRRCALAVRIKVTYTSQDRPDTFADTNTRYPFSEFKGRHGVTRYGTGSIVQAFYHLDSLKVKFCPCHLCKMSGKPETNYWWIRVRTATHVIHDRSEAELAEFDCFYDTDDRCGVKTIYGFDTFNAMVGAERKYCNDVCDVLCVTHNWDTVKALSRINPLHNFLHPPSLTSGHAPSRVIVSHPHGCSKKLTVGNILHLTVPIGADYPVNCEIPFKKGTMYRKASNEGKSMTQNSESDKINVVKEELAIHKIENASKDFNLALRNFNLKEKLDSVIKTSPGSGITSTAKEVDENCAEKAKDKMTDPVPIEKYLVDFYNLFLREHCLKILLICTILHQRNNRQQRGMKTLKYQTLLKQAFEQVFYTFLGKEMKLSNTAAEEHSSEMSSIHRFGTDPDSTHNYWLRLWKESDEEYAKFRSKNELSLLQSKDLSPSIIVAWFAEVEKIMDAEVLSRKEEGLIINEDLLHTVVEKGLKAGIKILMTHDELWKEGKSHCGTAKNYRDKEEDKDKINERNNIDKVESNDDDDDDDDELGEERENEEYYQNVPDEATFILPPDASYAFRVYDDNPGWITFPPGTVMKMRDGKEENIGYPAYEFKHPSMQPERSFVMYDINTCPGSSGANVYCALMGKFLGTYFPHSGHIRGNCNRSGMRDNFYTLFSKMLLFDPRDILSREETDSGGDKFGENPLQLIEGCKLIMLNLKEILRK